MEQFQLQPGLNRLPRGGYLIDTSIGYVQFGSPPETIKDTMVLEKKVPQVFVLPDELFNIEKGIAVGELEFPIYYNHFLCQKKTTILGTDEQKEQLMVVLRESVFGPETIDLSAEYPDGKDHDGFPDMESEIRFFRGNRKLDDLIDFQVFKEGQVAIDNLLIKRADNTAFEVYDNSEKLADVPLNIDYHMKYDIGKGLPEPYEPPEFGITCLGPSHGFDPNDNTSGFILWVNNRGIMIDPPVNSTEWLRKSNVNPKLIDHIILTHTHADHDAGTFQKILEEFPVAIHTTPTIMDSFIRKYTALTKLSRKQLYELFNFIPVTIERPMFIEGAKFIYHYTLHSIPTIGFRMHYQNQSFIYTSDHLNDPETIDKMYEQNIFPESRYKFLQNFPWESYNVIYHEAGIPPLHTPVSYLSSLPKEIQEKVTVYHIAGKDFPENTHLKLATFGIENTLYPEIKSHKYSDSIQMLDVLNHVDLFRDFSITKAREFLTIIEEKHFKRGELIIQKDTPGDSFFIIVSGNVTVRGVSSDVKKTYGNYEYFGEASVLTGEMRSADVIAETDVTALTIEQSAFLHFISGTTLETDLRKLIDVRKSNSWDVLSKSKVFGSMTSHQKTQMEGLMHQIEVEKGTTLIYENKLMDTAFILVSGDVQLVKGDKEIRTFESGDFVGDIFGLQKNNPATFDAVVKEDAVLYMINRSDLTSFVQQNPGIYMRLIRTHEETFM